MTKKINIILLMFFFLFTAGNFTIANAQTRPEVRLVLQITIDGLRADLINRYENGFGKGGFRFLMEKGTYYTNAHYQHANTETIVGHTTLATGTFPSQHGMIGNVWFDHEAGELAYNIEDPNHPIIPSRENVSKGEQVDPAQKKSRTQGRSPAVIVQLDRTLADLFAFIEKSVGLKYTLVVLSADHGMADMPEYMTELGYKAGRLDPDEIVAIANKAGQKLGVDEIVRFFYRPYLYLNDEKIATAKLDRMKVEHAIADALTDFDGIALAVASSRLSAHQTNPLLEQVRNNHHVSRSGDIYIIQEPYWFLFDKGPVAAMHGSPWRYDTHVPIFFAGPTIDAQMVHRRVHPVDVAPTIAAFLGMTPPPSAQGTPLEEVLE